MATDNDEDYDHLLILDVDPRPNYPYVCCVSVANTGIKGVHHGRLKLSKNFRLRPIELPIYREKKQFHVIAKTHKSCSSNDRNRATALVNEHISNCVKTGMTMDSTVASTIENYPCRVLKGRNFGAMNEPTSKYIGTSARHMPLALSSSETDVAPAKTAFPPKTGQFSSFPLSLSNLPIFFPNHACIYA